MNIAEELRSAGVLPTGPVSAWPHSRHIEMIKQSRLEHPMPSPSPRVTAGPAQMAAGLIKTAGQALVHGRVSEEIRNERYSVCQDCPFFIKDSKRCSDCGCFMEAKTWIGGDPDTLCPQKKWSR